MRGMPTSVQKVVKVVRELDLIPCSRQRAPQSYPYLDVTGPIALAHRGGAKDAPENTTAAFDSAIAAGFTYLELDIHLSSDGVLMVIHDARLDRTTDMQGDVRDFTARELETADAGYWYTTNGKQSFPFRGHGVGIPRLEDLLNRYPDIHFNIDPKSDEGVAPLIDVLERTHAWDRVGIACGSHKRIEAVRQLAGERVPTAMSPREVLLALAAARRGELALPRQGADYIQMPLYHHSITARFVRQAHRAGLRVHAWTIDDPAAMEYLFDIGCDGIMTNDPELLRRVMERRGLWPATQVGARPHRHLVRRIRHHGAEAAVVPPARRAVA